MKIKSLQIIFLFLCIHSYAQELPPIVTYPPEEYQADNQNWMVSQDYNKHIFIANSAGLLQFDGAKWTLYGSPNGSVLRSVKVVEELVYSGCYMEFGYWEKDEFGGFQYNSLVPKLKEPLIDDEQFWNILKVDDWILFQSLDRIYIYNTIDETFKIINSQAKRARIFNIGTSVFFQKSSEGIYKIENGDPILVLSDPVFKDYVLVGAFQVDDKILFISENGDFYFLNDTGLSKWNIEADEELSKVNIYSSIQLNDGSFILGTISDGFYHIGPSGNLLEKINKEKGLNNNTVLSMFQDQDDNLWLGLDNGISVININSPFTEYKDLKGKIGSVYAAKIFNEHLYIGTNQGLFYKRKNTSDKFKLIKGTKGQVWSLQLVHSTLFCGHNKGTFVVTDNNAKLISDFPGTWGVKPLNFKDDLVIQGNYNGLSILEKKDEEWSLRNTIEGFTVSSRFFEIDSLDVIVNHEQKGLYNIKLDQSLQNVLSIDNELPKGHSSNIFYFKNQLYYKTHKDIYSFSDSFKKTVVDSNLTQLIFANNETPFSLIIPDTNGQKLWYFTNNAIKYIPQSNLSGNLSEASISMPNILRNNLGVAGFENISRIANNEYLIGSSNGYVTLNLTKVSSTDHQIKLNSIYYGDYQNVTNRTTLKSSGEFSYSLNNLKFQYSVPEFDKYTEIKYQYKLNGLFGEWSELSEISEITFKNLLFGKYDFSVRAMVGNNMSQNTVSYSFVILRPWYFSNTLILLYSLGLILLFFTIHKFYKRYYRRKQESIIYKSEKELERRKLEEKEKIAQILNEKLQVEIENKNKELAISTMSIIKKNKFLNSIKDQLKEVENSPKVKSILKTINSNINNTDDWKFFEEAFNNADKDFLKKMKSLHPDLTPNDLKLCAYLRLNLTSKEIAPLLNISVRSVEVKRYRLRKKMALPHENSLTDYILSL